MLVKAEKSFAVQIVRNHKSRFVNIIFTVSHQMRSPNRSFFMPCVSGELLMNIRGVFKIGGKTI